MRRLSKIGIAVLCVAGLAPVAAASAAPSTVSTPPVSSTTLSDAVASEPFTIHTHGSRHILNRRGVIQPGATTGWHAHTGPMITLVQSGVLTWIDEHCVRHDTRAGQSVVIPAGPPASQDGFNLGAEPVVLYVVDVLPPEASGPTVNVPNPGCVDPR